MKVIAILLLAWLGACAPSEAKSKLDRNFAEESVMAIEPDAKCVRMYQGDGPHQTHSVKCRLPAKLEVYCVVNTETALVCTPLNNQPSSQAPPQTSTSEPAKK